MNTKQISQIIKGHVDELLNNNNNLAKSRLEICKTCPIMKPTLGGPICSSSLCLNKATGEVISAYKPGYTCGCGCRLNAKTRISDAHCVLNKW